MLSLQYVKPYILHPEKVIRDFAVGYFKDCSSKDPELMPLVLQSCGRTQNDLENRLMLVYASGFTRTAESMQELFERVFRRGPATDCYERIIINSEPACWPVICV